MDDGTGELARAIGARVRAARTGRQWSLDRLAEAAGVSRRMLVNVEQGSANPSVGILLRLAEALGVGLPTLVEPPRSGAMTVTRAGDAATLWSSEAGGRGRLMSSSSTPDTCELWEWMLMPGDSHSSEAHADGTRELIHVREGSLTVEVDGHRAVVDAGEAISFPGDVDHSYANSGSAPVHFSLAVFEPGEGPSHRGDRS